MATVVALSQFKLKDALYPRNHSPFVVSFVVINKSFLGMGPSLAPTNDTRGHLMFYYIMQSKGFQSHQTAGIYLLEG